VDMSGLDGATQRGPRREQATLPDHFVEGSWPHAFGKRTQRILIRRQQIGFGTGRK